MNIFSKMDNLVSLTENEKILVSYIKENPEAFVKMTSAEISEASFISNATIYRLCKKLDLAGLSELKILVSSSVGDYLKERTTLDFNYPIHPNETQYQITRTMQELYEQTVVSSLNNLDLEQLRQAASLMKKMSGYRPIHLCRESVFRRKLQVPDAGNRQIRQCPDRGVSSTFDGSRQRSFASFHRCFIRRTGHGHSRNREDTEE